MKKQIVDKLVALERDLCDERGAFLLFALLLRDEAPGKWDLIASAPWLHPDRRKDWVFLVERVRDRLSSSEYLDLSRIVLLEHDNPVLKAIQAIINVEHGTFEIRETSIDGLYVKHGFVITSIRRKGRARSGNRGTH